VVNVGPAAKIIKTGQRIEVDANQGIVQLLAEVLITGQNKSTNQRKPVAAFGNKVKK